jgi:uridine kinase
MDVIGICGPSGSGKSTIAGFLSSLYNTPNLSLDNYAFETSVNGNWEIPDSYDMHGLCYEIGSSSRKIVIVEGFLIFAFPPLLKIINHKVYIYLPTDEVIKRRKNRYNVAHRELGQEYIGNILKPYSKMYADEQIEAADLVVDGRRNLHSITGEVIEFLSDRIGR